MDIDEDIEGDVKKRKVPKAAKVSYWEFYNIARIESLFAIIDLNITEIKLCLLFYNLV